MLDFCLKHDRISNHEKKIVTNVTAVPSIKSENLVYIFGNLSEIHVIRCCRPRP